MPSMRFHVSDLSERLIRLDADESRHAKKVMRVKVGDGVELFDGRGAVASGRVVAVTDHVAVEPGPVTRVEPLKPRIELAVAIPKGDRAAFLVEKASELGADRLIPILTERSVVDPGAGKIDRLRRIALESAKQCGRAWLMEISEPTDFNALVASSDHETRLIADLGVAGVEVATSTSKQSAKPRHDQSGRVIILIGPEGGWTDDERAAAYRAGFHPWRLGPHILRTETAALAALAILRHEP